MEQLLTTLEVAQKLRQDVATIQKWCRLGILPVVKIGRKFLFQEKDLESWVEEHKTVKSPKERLSALADQGQEYFKKWCKTRGIDYKRLSEDEVMRLVNEAITGHRKKTSV